MGVIAKDLVAVLTKRGVTELGLVNDKDGYMSERYNDLLAPLFRTVQELSADNEILKSELKHFQSQINRLDAIEASIELLLSNH